MSAGWTNEQLQANPQGLPALARRATRGKAERERKEAEEKAQRDVVGSKDL